MKKLTLFLTVIFTFTQINLFSAKAVSQMPPEIKTIDIKGLKESQQNSKHTNEVIIKYKDGSISVNSYDDLNIEKVKINSDTELQKVMNKYRTKQEVELVQPNYVYKASTINDIYRNNQWGLNLIEAEGAWSVSPSMGQGIKIAVLDSGIDLDHEDLAANIIGGYNAINGGSYDDDDGHGTIVAGIIGAIPNNSVGGAGVAGKASLLAVKVLDKDGYGTSESISKGIRWAADNDADILNLSLGANQDDPLIKQAIDYAYNKGCVIIAAAGNDFSDSVSYPAAYSNVIAVSALNEANGLADFSNYGPEIDIAAPGVNIFSTAPNHSTSCGVTNYGYASGTSMSAPYVSGVAALIKAQNPALTPNEIKQILVNNTYDLGNAGNDILYGYGALNSFKSLGGISNALYKKVNGDSFEDNNGYILSKTYNSSSSIKGNIYPKNDSDWYKLVVPGGMLGKIQFSSPSGANNEIYVLEDAETNPTLKYYGIKNGQMDIPASSIPRNYYIAIFDLYSQESIENYTLDFTVKGLPPAININGVSNGGIYNYTLAPEIVVTNGSYTAKLNGSPYTSKTPIIAEGNYTLTVTGNNGYGDVVNSTTSFTIDRTSPVLSISGISNGGVYTSYVTPSISTNEGTVSASLNGVNYIPGTPIKTNGTYTLTAEALDSAGNKSTASISFQINLPEEPIKIGISYQAHVENIGWQNWSQDGSLMGTQGQGLRLEALRMKLVNAPADMRIKYQVHIQNIGWQDYVSNGQLSGTEGKSLRLEGVRIQLENAPGYSIQYQAHVQNVGWQDWVQDGAVAGTYGKSLRVEALRVRIVKTSDLLPSVQYQGHVQNIGWQNWVGDGAEVGTDGKSLRVEGLKIKLVNVPANMKIKYQAHVQNIGWMDWVSDGQLAGTSGMSLRIEGIRVMLENAPGYSIQYQAHVQNIGWMDWVQDGAVAGTSGKSLRVEALRIKLVKN